MSTFVLIGLLLTVKQFAVTTVYLPGQSKVSTKFFNGFCASGPCGKSGDKLLTATVVRARRKNAGIAGRTSKIFNAAMPTVGKKSVIELSAQPTSGNSLEARFESGGKLKPVTCRNIESLQDGWSSCVNSATFVVFDNSNSPVDQFNLANETRNQA